MLEFLDPLEILVVGLVREVLVRAVAVPRIERVVANDRKSSRRNSAAILNANLILKM